MLFHPACYILCFVCLLSWSHLTLRWINEGRFVMFLHCIASFTSCYQDFRINIWDASGDLKFMDVRNEFYKETQGVILALWLPLRRGVEETGGRGLPAAASRFSI